MSDVSAIEWTHSTWNVVTGCTRVSPGCAHCYIERTPPFRIAGRRFERDGDGSTTGLVLHPERLERVPKGPRVFVNSLSDLFHEEIPDPFLDLTFEAMANAPDRIFQVLTKRPERARDYLNRGHFQAEPLPNVWLGVSIENARYTWRADVLREIPAAVRFVSAEPLLGSLGDAGREGDRRNIDEPGGTGDQALVETAATYPSRRALDLTGIDWLIVGGESGPNARPMHLEWVRELLRACRTRTWRDAKGELRETAFFFKQWGEWAPETRDPRYQYVHYHRAREIVDVGGPQGSAQMARIGKKAAGRMLDGRTWDEFPKTRQAVAA